MSKKPIKYILVVVILFLLGYNSVYFRKLDVINKAAAGQFDATTFTSNLWKEKMRDVISEAVNLRTVDSLLQSNPKETFASYSNSLSIGNYRYFMVRTTGTVDSVREDDVLLDVATSRGYTKLSVATEFVYGNSIRDASKLVRVEDFT